VSCAGVLYCQQILPQPFSPGSTFPWGGLKQQVWNHGGFWLGGLWQAFCSTPHSTDGKAEASLTQGAIEKGLVQCHTACKCLAHLLGTLNLLHFWALGAWPRQTEDVYLWRVDTPPFTPSRQEDLCSCLPLPARLVEEEESFIKNLIGKGGSAQVTSNFLTLPLFCF
jgi:hypothetical protein